MNQRIVEYELKDCPYCNETIPEYRDNGTRRTKSCYEKMVTCGRAPCLFAHCKGSTSVKKVAITDILPPAYALDPWDKFLRINPRTRVA
jgi:hypothetical protein